MVFRPHEGRHIEHIPDDILLPDLIFSPQFGRRPLSQSNKALFIDAPTGRQIGFEETQERMEALAVGLKEALKVESGWSGVIGFFAPNNVCLACEFCLM